MSGISMGDYKKLTLETLAKLDHGRVGVAVGKAIEAVARDLDDRPGLNKDRTVLLKIKAKPVPDPDNKGIADTATISIDVETKIPVRSSKPYSMALRKGGHLAYREGSEDDHRQGNFLPAADE